LNKTQNHKTFWLKIYKSSVIFREFAVLLLGVSIFIPIFALESTMKGWSELE